MESTGKRRSKTPKEPNKKVTQININVKFKDCEDSKRNDVGHQNLRRVILGYSDRNRDKS